MHIVFIFIGYTAFVFGFILFWGFLSGWRIKDLLYEIVVFLAIGYLLITAITAYKNIIDEKPKKIVLKVVK